MIKFALQSCALILVFSTVAEANPFRFLFRGKDKPRPSMRMTYHYTPEKPIQGQSANLQASRYGFHFFTPISVSKKNTWYGMLSSKLLNVNNNAVFPKTNVDLPSSFKSLRATAIYQHDFSETKTLGSTFSLGSASDRLFFDSEVTIISANLFYRLITSKASSWLFLLNYSNNRTFWNNIPLPGVAYAYIPSKELKLFVGAMNSIYYRFSKKWGVSFSYLPVKIIRSKLSYFLFGPAQVYVGFNWDIESYLRAGRLAVRDRVYFQQKKAVLGAMSPISKSAMVFLSAGWAFGRRVSESDSSLTDSGAVVDADSSVFLNAAVAYRF